MQYFIVLLFCHESEQLHAVQTCAENKCKAEYSAIELLNKYRVNISVKSVLTMNEASELADDLQNQIFASGAQERIA